MCSTWEATAQISLSRTLNVIIASMTIAPYRSIHVLSSSVHVHVCAHQTIFVPVVYQSKRVWASPSLTSRPLVNIMRRLGFRSCNVYPTYACTCTIMYIVYYIYVTCMKDSEGITEQHVQNPKSINRSPKHVTYWSMCYQLTSALIHDWVSLS